MNDFRYILERYSGMKSRYTCPACNHKNKTFVRYIDNDTGNHIHSTVGKCNRESNCQYHLTPKQYFDDNNINPIPSQHKSFVKPQTKKPNPISYISPEIFKSSLNCHDTNNFVKFLSNKFTAETANLQISNYFVGTSKHWPGATVFWQIDSSGKIHTGKIMLYNPTTGKRVKEPFSHIAWVHKVLKLDNYELKQCMFGEHLLIDKTKPVALVESEKTAIIASLYMPQYIWLAVGSLTNLTAEKCKVLNGRKVILFPDLNAYDKWCQKADELSHIAQFSVSDLLEQKANEAERQQGLDLADYLLRFNYTDFSINHQPQPIEPKTPYIQIIDKTPPISNPLPEYNRKYNSIFPQGKREAYLAALEKKYSNPIIPLPPVTLRAI